MTETVRIGVLGCADIAVRRVLPELAEMASAELVAVASRDHAKARGCAERFGCAAVAGYQQMLERDDIDALYVPLPPGLHHEWVSQALLAGKDVLVEKPMSVSYAQSLELVELAARQGRVLVENFIFLHHSQHRAVADMIAAQVGTLRTFSSAFAVPPLPPGSFRYRPELGGGGLIDIGVYPLRVAQHYLAGDLAVLGAFLLVDEATGVDVAGSALLCDDNGVTAHLDFGFAHAYQCTYGFWGTQGRLTVQRAFTPPEDYRPVLRLEQQDRVSELVLPADRQVRNALESFVAAVRQRRVAAVENHPSIRLAALIERVRKAATVRVAATR
jgi:dTDP-3,4-didehydro-2,6-dideoxy-alpha-D-glucose 3-reductase